jgi:hypothetical protein
MISFLVVRRSRCRCETKTDTFRIGDSVSADRVAHQTHSVRHDPKDDDPAYAIAEVRQDGSETMILHPTDDLKQMFGAE